MAGGKKKLPRLFLLGRFRLENEDGRDISPNSAKARALLGYVALSPNGVADRGTVAGLLWSEGRDAKASLRQCIKELTALFGEEGLNILAVDRFRLTLDLERVWIDALTVDQLVQFGRADNIAQLTAAYGGDLLADVSVRDAAFDEWLQIERSRRRKEVLDALESELRHLSETARPQNLKAVADALLAIEPTHEEAHRCLMRFYANRGDLPAAIRQYQHCSNALAQELDMAPSAETDALLQDLRRAETGEQAAPVPAPAPSVVVKPVFGVTIAVEPFVVRPQTEPYEHLGHAVTNQIREALSRFRWLFIVDPEAPGMLTQPASTSQIGVGSQPRYVVRGGAIWQEDLVRLGIELKQTETARVIWADHCDRPARDLLDLVDDMVAAVVGRLESEVRLAEIRKAWRTPENELTAHDCVLRAIPLIYEMTKDSFVEAEALLQKAHQLDPDESATYAWHAFLSFLKIGQGWTDDVEAARAEVGWLARRAIELDPQDGLALAIAGHVESFVYHEYEHALSYFDRSLRINPNSGYGWALSAITHCYVGQAGEALKRLGRYGSIWPYDPHPYFFQTARCIAYSLEGKHEKAVALGKRILRENPNFNATYRPLIASLGHLGRIDEARMYLRRLQNLEPGFSIDWFRENYPPLQDDDCRRYIEGFRKAGVPEG